MRTKLVLHISFRFNRGITSASTGRLNAWDYLSFKLVRRRLCADRYADGK